VNTNKLTIALIIAIAAASAAGAEEPVTIELAPQIFSYSSEPGTLRAGVRWGEISVRGSDGYEVEITARVIPENGRRYDRSIHDLIDLRIEERDNVMDLRADSRMKGFFGVELEIAVPRSTRLELEMTGGGPRYDFATANGTVYLRRAP
jgi:hypothetical protein